MLISLNNLLNLGPCKRSQLAVIHYWKGLAKNFLRYLPLELNDPQYGPNKILIHNCPDLEFQAFISQKLQNLNRSYFTISTRKYILMAPKIKKKFFDGAATAAMIFC